MLTVESLEGKGLRRVGQEIGRGDKGNYFTEWSRYDEVPRLKRQRTVYSRLGLQDEEVWLADGEVMGSLQQALDWLNATPLPAISITERTVLEYISDEWMALPGTPEHVRTLADKGLIEFEKHGASRLRRTELARQLLAEED
jgi:hypothetical protein